MPCIIVFHIEQLVLSGFPPSERYRIADALQGALTESLASGALHLPASLASRGLDALEPQRLNIVGRHNATRLGAGVASALVAGIGDALAPAGGRRS